MIPRSYYSFALTFSLLSLWRGNHTTLPDYPTKTEAIDKIRTLLRSVTDQIDIQDTQFNLVTEDNQGVQIAGTATLFNIQNVQIQATVGNTLTDITATFPNGAGHQIQLSGQNLSDWFPDFLRNKLDLQQIQFQFFPQEDHRLALAATLSPPTGGNLIAYQRFSIQQPTLTFRLARRGGATPGTTATAALGGKLKLGALQFDLAATANTNREWTLVGTLNELKVIDLVRNIGTHLTITVPSLPAPIENFTIQQASLSLHSDRSARLKGTCDFGKVEAYLGGSSNNFLVGFAPNTDYKLARISSVLQPIDALGLTDLAMVYAATADQIDQELEILADKQLGSQTVKPGLTLMGGFDLPDDLPGVSTKGKVVMRANLPASLAATPTLQAAAQFNGLQLGNAFRLNEAFVQLAPIDVSFGAGLSVGLNLDGNWLNLSGLGELTPPATIAMSVFMEEGSVWNQPFGVKGVTISNLGLDMGANLATVIPTPVIGLSGALKIGPFEGSAVGNIDCNVPLNSLISLKLNQMGMQQFINAFSSQAIKNEMNKLPAQLRDFGLQDVEMTIIPKTTVVAGRTYTQGLRVAGKANIAGLGARLDVNAGFDNGLLGIAAVSPLIIREGNVTIFELTGNNAVDSARMAIDLTYQNVLQGKHPFYLIDGKVSLLGISNQTKVEINRDGVYFYNKGKLFNKFETELDAKGGNFNDVKGLYIRAAMKNDLIQYLNREATTAIDQATKDSQNAYRKAKNDLSEAETYLRNTQKDVDAFNRQKDKVDAAQRDVDKLADDVRSAKRSCDKAPWYRKADRCAKYAALKGSLETARGVLNGYKETLNGLSKAVDWSKRNIAANTVAASRTVLDGFDKATTGSMKAAKWIVDKGLGGVIDVRSAEFAGQLDAVKGGNVTLQTNVKFLNEDFNAGFTLNFNDPINGAKALADMMLNNRAPKGFTATFGGQIKPRS